MYTHRSVHNPLTKEREKETHGLSNLLKCNLQVKGKAELTLRQTVTAYCPLEKPIAILVGLSHSPTPVRHILPLKL